MRMGKCLGTENRCSEIENLHLLKVRAQNGLQEAGARLVKKGETQHFFQSAGQNPSMKKFEAGGAGN